METLEEIKYREAAKRVKRIKSFYTHLVVYVVINIVIFVVNAQSSSEGIWHWRNFTTAFFWGIGLASHAISVFLPGAILGSDWEEKKIKQLMEKEKQNKWE